MNNMEAKLRHIRFLQNKAQLEIADDLERFGKIKEANQCRDEAWRGILRPDWWNDRVEMIFDINDI